MLSLSLGLTVIVYGGALLADHTYPKWIGGLALVGGVPTVVSGVVMAYTGFSGLAMAINMPASSLLLVWMLALGVFMWRRGEVHPMKRQHRAGCTWVYQNREWLVLRQAQHERRDTRWGEQDRSP